MDYLIVFFYMYLFVVMFTIGGTSMIKVLYERHGGGSTRGRRYCAFNPVTEVVTGDV